MYRISFDGRGGQGMKSAHPYVRAPPTATYERGAYLITPMRRGGNNDSELGACSSVVGTYLLYRPWPGDHSAVSAAHAQSVETVARQIPF